MVQQGFYVTGDADFALITREIGMAEYEAFTGRLLLTNPNVRRFTTLVAIGHAPIATAIPFGGGGA